VLRAYLSNLRRGCTSVGDDVVHVSVLAHTHEFGVADLRVGRLGRDRLSREESVFGLVIILDLFHIRWHRLVGKNWIDRYHQVSLYALLPEFFRSFERAGRAPKLWPMITIERRWPFSFSYCAKPP
jgi:hypothetical protein